MLRIEQGMVERVAHARSAADLHDLVQNAIRLEFSTIPPYLTALLSLHPGKNREIWSIIHEVVVEEMLHMTIGCNILNAIGGTPTIAAPDFLPVYPGPLPMGIGGLTVPLEKFSLDLVRSVFMEIEEPEKPLDIPLVGGVAAATPQFATIGSFYAALKAKLGELGDAIFTGDPARQVVPLAWFGSDRSLAITGSAAAMRAIDLIVEEGEGRPDTPFDPDGGYAHYYKFWEIAELRRIAADASAPDGFAFSGAAIPFDAAAVWDLTPNQTLDGLDRDSLAGRRASQFSFVFTKLMHALQVTFDGSPQGFDAAMGLMFELKLAGQMLVQLPAVVNGVPTGRNAGPVFRYSLFPM